MSAHCGDNGVHFTGIFPVRWTPFFFGVRFMSINEQLECRSSAGADPSRLRRVKCCAAGAGILALLVLIMMGALENAHADAQQNLTQAQWISP